MLQTNKHDDKQTNIVTNKHTNEHDDKQTNKQASKHTWQQHLTSCSVAAKDFQKSQGNDGKTCTITSQSQVTTPTELQFLNWTSLEHSVWSTLFAFKFQLLSNHN